MKFKYLLFFQLIKQIAKLEMVKVEQKQNFQESLLRKIVLQLLESSIQQQMELPWMLTAQVNADVGLNLE